jgi:hypothetical protein
MIKLTDILKKLIKEEDQAPVNSEFEADPMDYILRKYKRLNNNLTVLMGDSFKEYLGGIFIMSGKPTTFKVLLKNGQYFFMTFMGKAYEATVLGKRYYLMNLGEVQRATIAISRLLRFGTKSTAQGPTEESGSRSEELPSSGEEPASEPESEETT